MSLARLILEAESAKAFIKRLSKTVLLAGDGYYVALGPPPLDLTGKGSTTEFCPWRLYSGSTGSDQLDGMYGLIDDIHRYFNFESSLQRYSEYPEMLSLTDEQEDQIGKVYEHYLDQVHAGLSKAQASGVVNGVLGPRAWQLVYWPRTMARPQAIDNNFVVR